MLGSPIQVGDELVLIVAHSRPEVSDASICLLGPSQVGLRDEHVAHRQHPKSSQFLGGVEHHRWEPAGHLGVQTNLDTSLNLYDGGGQ